MIYLPPDVPVRYSRRLSLFLIGMCAVCAVILAAVASIDDGHVPVTQNCYRC